MAARMGLAERVKTAPQIIDEDISSIVSRIRDTFLEQNTPKKAITLDGNEVLRVLGDVEALSKRADRYNVYPKRPGVSNRLNLLKKMLRVDHDRGVVELGIEGKTYAYRITGPLDAWTLKLSNPVEEQMKIAEFLLSRKE